MFRRRSTRSATAPASGPSRSAGSREASQTPLTAAVCVVVALPPRLAASVDRASRLSQSPRLDRDVATHSRRNGLMDSTLPVAVLAGGGRGFTALGYRQRARSAAFLNAIVPAHSSIFPGETGRLGQRADGRQSPGAPAAGLCPSEHERLGPSREEDPAR